MRARSGGWRASGGEPVGVVTPRMWSGSSPTSGGGRRRSRGLGVQGVTLLQLTTLHLISALAPLNLTELAHAGAG